MHKEPNLAHEHQEMQSGSADKAEFIRVSQTVTQKRNEQGREDRR